MSRLRSLVNSSCAFWAGALLWLPAGVMLTALARFSGQPVEPMEWTMLFAGLGSLVLVAPCGLPLAIACRQLHRSGYPAAAWGAMAGLGIVTTGASLIAGLLGPFAIAVYAIILSLPIWLAVAIVRYLHRRRT